MSLDTRVARPAAPVHREPPARRKALLDLRIGGPLQNAIMALNEAQRLTPCAEMRHMGDLWCSDSRAERLIAAEMCHGCPALAECDEDATRRDEKWNVWGGRDRTPR